MPHIIPNHDPNRIITFDNDGYHIDQLGDEQVSVDESTGEVCRKRPAIARINMPIIDLGSLAAILTDRLRSAAATEDKSGEMALTLQQRANLHILAFIARQAKKGGAS